jgi:hypothetical protein
MAEVQNHGNLFEAEVIKTHTGYGKDEYQTLMEGGYTSSFDMAKGVGNSKGNYSIKATGNGGIGCGDILRFFKHCRDSEFTMVLGVWKQVNKTQKQYSEIYEIEFNPETFKKVWGNLTVDELEPFVEYVKSIQPGKEAQITNRKVWKEKRKSIYDKVEGCVMKIDAKIDSKNQRRVQCSVSIDDLINAGLTVNKYTNNYHTIKLPYVQASAPRTFN